MNTILSWLNCHPDPPLIYAERHVTRSANRASPRLGFLFQEIGEYDWWESGGVRYRLPNRHVRLSCGNVDSRSSPPPETVALWAVAFNIVDEPVFENLFGESAMVFVSDPETLKWRFQNVVYHHHARDQEPDGGVLLKAALLELTAAIARELRGGGRRTHPDREVVDRAKRFMIRQTANPDVTLSDVARHVGLTVNQLGRVFRRGTDTTPMRFLRGVRIGAAERLLRESVLRIDEIAWETGFSDPSHFSRVFRATTRESPREFRGRRF